MTIKEANKYIREYKEKDIREIVFEMRDAYLKHSQNIDTARATGLPIPKQNRLTNREIFVLGLRYSEFYAEANTDEAYYQAEVLRGLILDKLGYTVEAINTVVYKILGWS